MRIKATVLVTDNITYSARDKVEFSTDSRLPRKGEVVTVQVGKHTSIVRVEDAELNGKTSSVLGKLIRRL